MTDNNTITFDTLYFSICLTHNSVTIERTTETHRKARFNHEERSILVQEFSKHKDVLFNKFSDVATHKKRLGNRSTNEALRRKQMKKTGGGKLCCDTLDETEQCAFRIIGDTAIEGVEEGTDTFVSEPSTSTAVVNDHVLVDEDVNDPEPSKDNKSEPASSKSMTSTKQRNIMKENSNEEEIITIEKERLEIERQRLAVEKDALTLKSRDSKYR
ncbi:uncharacterized protein [Haliotis asinina]|uniref:uncharacterized protein n=1 Tax=Haliotis asinina TaxID=109174 RepID=UPI0035324AC8